MSDVYFCEITNKKLLADEIVSITIKCEEIARKAVAGQFLHIKCGTERILRRPLGICDINRDEVRFVFEIAGEGTKWLSKCEVLQSLNVLGPLGNGFTVPSDKNPSNKVLIIGGGIGAPPMLFTAKSVVSARGAGPSNENASGRKSGVEAILGFRSKNSIILSDEFRQVCDDIIITTDDGSAGIKGTVIEPLKKLLEKGNIGMVMSCGPFVMQKAVAKLLLEFSVPYQVSLEERMGCGVGACLVCACATYDLSKETRTLEMSHVCIDGPVFDACNVAWQSG